MSRKISRALTPLAAAAALLLSATAGAAGACDTPMPKEVKIAAPAPSLSPDQARLLGVWQGAWTSGIGRICAALAVTSIEPDGTAKLICFSSLMSRLSKKGTNLSDSICEG